MADESQGVLPEKLREFLQVFARSHAMSERDFQWLNRHFFNWLKGARWPEGCEVLESCCIQVFDLVAERGLLVAVLGDPSGQALDPRYAKRLDEECDAVRELVSLALSDPEAGECRAACHRRVMLAIESRRAYWLETAYEKLLQRLETTPPAAVPTRQERAEGTAAGSSETKPSTDAERVTPNAAVADAPVSENHPEPPGTSHQAAGSRRPPVQLDAWEDLTIRFISDRTIQVYVGRKAGETFTYSEFGLEDHRRPGHPRCAWDTLRALAGGPVTTTFKNRRTVETRIKEIRGLLRGHFRAPGLPIATETDHKTGERRYRPRFAVDASVDAE